MEWQAIDDQIVTETHETLQILPCAFPHSEYLRENNVEPPKNVNEVHTKVAKRKQQILKIQPKDDSHYLFKKIQKKESRRNVGKKIISQKKQNKKMRYRARRQMKLETKRIESKELETTKELLVATMDQYETPSGQSLFKSIEASSSIATRTRRQSRCLSSPEKSQVKNVRRSNRVATNKFS